MLRCAVLPPAAQRRSRTVENCLGVSVLKGVKAEFAVVHRGDNPFLVPGQREAEPAMPILVRGRGLHAAPRHAKANQRAQVRLQLLKHIVIDNEVVATHLQQDLASMLASRGFGECLKRLGQQHGRPGADRNSFLLKPLQLGADLRLGLVRLFDLSGDTFKRRPHRTLGLAPIPARFEHLGLDSPHQVLAGNVPERPVDHGLSGYDLPDAFQNIAGHHVLAGGRLASALCPVRRALRPPRLLLAPAAVERHLDLERRTVADRVPRAIRQARLSLRGVASRKSNNVFVLSNTVTLLMTVAAPELTHPRNRLATCSSRLRAARTM